jgi:hypothetical protein
MEWDEVFKIICKSCNGDEVAWETYLKTYAKKLPDGYQYYTKADTTILDAMDFKFTKFEDAVVNYMDERRNIFKLPL